MNPAIKYLFSRRLVICLGTGGVGKTTVSAALAISAARSGRAVDVMTIDPAPRLLDALGLDGEASVPRQVALTRIARGGRLRAMRLDPKHTFDRLIEQHAPSPEVRNAILSNRIYRNLSSALAGIADYMAIERLLELYADESNDLIMLDTPPAREALDFLEAPARLLALLNSRAMGLLGPSRGIISLADSAARAVLAAFDRLTGIQILTDLRALLAGFESMYEGFAERAQRARDLIIGDSTHVVLVTTAESERVAQLEPFVQALLAERITIGAVVANRAGAGLPKNQPIEGTRLDRDLGRRLVRNLNDFRALERRQEMALDLLRRSVPAGTPIIMAPEFEAGAEGLQKLADFAAAMEPA
jgi:anion-transporting  ArsA/GET3 family ATPase